jgi:hypothetical protein
VIEMRFIGGPLDGQTLEIAEEEFSPIYNYAIKRTPLNAEYVIAASVDGVYEMQLHRYTSAAGNLYPDYHTGLGISIDEAIEALSSSKLNGKAFALAIDVLRRMKASPKAVALLGGFDNIEAQKMIAEAEA